MEQFKRKRDLQGAVILLLREFKESGEPIHWHVNRYYTSQPNLCIVVCGLALFVLLQSKSGVISDRQKQAIIEWEDGGAATVVARTVHDVRKAVEYCLGVEC